MSHSIDLLLERGNQLLQQQCWEEAIETFAQALSVDARCAAAYFGRSQALLETRKWGEASDDLDDAERLGLINEPSLYRSRAKASYFGGYSQEFRLADAERVIELIPDDPDGWFYRGDALSDLGDYELGIESFSRAIELNPNHADAYFQRGNAWNRLGESDRASTDFKTSTDLGSTDSNVYHRKGHFFQDKDDYEQAAKEFQKAIELEPDGWRHYQCGSRVILVLEAEGAVSHDEAEEFFIRFEQLKTGSNAVTTQDRHHIYNQVQDHFGRVPLEELELTERSFPPQALPDIQCAFDEMQNHGFEVVQFWATLHGNEPVQKFSTLYNRDRNTPVKPSNPKYKEFDIGEDSPFRCLNDGVWLLRSGAANLLALLDTQSNCSVVRIELAAPRSEEGANATERFFTSIEDSIKRSRCYRGKVLSMEIQDSYSGTASGLKVHRLGVIDRDHVILPQKTLDLLDRNVINFSRRRQQLAKLGMATKKGLLFYGPPGVGKTHTVHYLAKNLPGHTTLLVTGEQVGNLGEYMNLARLYQPSIVVVEDVDLIARHREEMRSSAEEVMLNKLLNEMDGITSDAEIIFVLTTNRVSVLEEALASRPGRIDQAIEFPLPNADGRAKLVRLYSHGITVMDDVVRSIVERSELVSASFIKELMRRCVQFALDRSETADSIIISDVDAALEEMLVTGGSLNQKLLGAVGRGEGREIGFIRRE